MTTIIPRCRSAALVLLCIFMAACTQTATSTYSGSIGHTSALSGDARQAKILASRERARARAKAKRKAFLEKRQSKKIKKKVLRKKKVAKTNRKKSRRKLTRKKISKKVAKRSRIKSKKKSRRIAKRLKSKSAKRKTSAFVGGRSRGISKNAPWRCVPNRLKKVIAQVSRKFGRVIINSTHRSRGKNRLIGGKRKSYHLRCQAVDFRVRGRTRGLTRWLARHPLVGGWKRYPAGYYHIDTGPKRTW